MTMTTIDNVRNVEITTYYRHEFELVGHPGSGYSFECDEQGVPLSINEAAINNHRKCISGEYNVIDNGIQKYEHEVRLCGCGSGKYPEDIYDARGIYVTRACSVCKKVKLSGYRPDIFENPEYETGDQVDADY